MQLLGSQMVFKKGKMKNRKLKKGKRNYGAELATGPGPPKKRAGTTLQLSFSTWRYASTARLSRILSRVRIVPRPRSVVWAKPRDPVISFSKNSKNLRVDSRLLPTRSSGVIGALADIQLTSVNDSLSCCEVIRLVYRRWVSTTSSHFLPGRSPPPSYHPQSSCR